MKTNDRKPNRRDAVGIAGALIAGSAIGGVAFAQDAAAPKGFIARYGLVNRLTAKAGQREELAQISAARLRGIAECRFLTGRDTKNENVLWIIEYWLSDADHARYSATPAWKAAVDKAKPLVEKFENLAVLSPTGGSLR
jgi:quinol monooxygenase YgiN